MKSVRRRFLLHICSCLPLLATEPGERLRGRLKQTGGRAFLERADGGAVLLEGDPPTEQVLRDTRLAGFDLEVIGRLTSPDRFQVDPIHTKAMFVHRDGRRLFITYWCEVCAIRTYAPGLCMCCQQETQLDLRESIEP
jgi:hypothetical protein